MLFWADTKIQYTDQRTRHQYTKYINSMTLSPTGVGPVMTTPNSLSKRWDRSAFQRLVGVFATLLKSKWVFKLTIFQNKSHYQATNKNRFFPESRSWRERGEGEGRMCHSFLKEYKAFIFTIPDGGTARLVLFWHHDHIIQNQRSFKWIE